MRPLPLVVSGASGAVAGIVLQVLRELSLGTVVPPGPDKLEPYPAAVCEALDFQASSFLQDLHLPSWTLGLICGLLAWPLLDFLLIVRWGLFRAARKAAKPFVPGELYRLTE